MSSRFRFSNKLQVSIFQISDKVQKGISMIFFFFWNLSGHKKMRNGRKWEMKENWRIEKWRAIENACFRDDVSSIAKFIFGCIFCLFLDVCPSWGCPSFHGFCFLLSVPFVVALVSCVGFFSSLVRPASLDLPRLFHLLQKSFATSSCPPCP